MAIEIIKIANKQQWLAERLQDVTSTEVSALYGLSPYMTSFELFCQKLDQTIVTIAPNDRMTWGTRLEPVIAYGAAADNGWEIKKLDVYMRDPDIRMGSSFDFEIVNDKRGPGILEIKNVDSLEYYKKWHQDDDGNIQAPNHIELQIQQQMAVSGYTWCALAVLVGGNTQKIIYRDKDDVICNDIRQKIAEFWRRVDLNARPNANGAMFDAAVVTHNYKDYSRDDNVITADDTLEQMIRDYHSISQDIKWLEKTKEERKEKILENIKDAAKVITSFGTLTCTMVKPSIGVTITQDMVGQQIKAREGYRNFRFFARD